MKNQDHHEYQDSQGQNCQDYEILISAAIDGELEPNEFDELESHVDHCERCRLQYQQLQTVTDWLVAHDRSESRLSTDMAWPTLSDRSDSKKLVETSARERLSEILPVNGHNGHSSALLSSPIDASESTTYVKRSEHKQPSDSNSHRGRNFLAGGMLAATAAGLAALLTTSPLDPPIPAVSVVDVSRPAERSAVLNEQSLALQESQTRFMEQELEILRLQAESCDGSPEEVELINHTIKSLSDRLRDLRAGKSLQP